MFIKKIHRSGQKTALRFYYVDGRGVTRFYYADEYGVDWKSNLRTAKNSASPRFSLAEHGMLTERLRRSVPLPYSLSQIASPSGTLSCMNNNIADFADGYADGAA